MTMEAEAPPRPPDWWHTTIIEAVDQMLDEQAIDWDAIKLSDNEIENGSLVLYTQKLQRATGYLSWVSTLLVKVDSRLSAVKDALTFSLTRRLALEENGEVKKPKGSQKMREVLFINSDDRLMEAQHLKVELTAKREALGNLKEALDLHWRTISRAISARMGEPLDR